jgi:hypothetical protein
MAGGRDNTDGDGEVIGGVGGSDGRCGRRSDLGRSRRPVKGEKRNSTTRVNEGGELRAWRRRSRR